MAEALNLYDNIYGDYDAQAAVRRATYGEDIGQSSWITATQGCGLPTSFVWSQQQRVGGRQRFRRPGVHLALCVQRLSAEPALALLLCH